MSDGFVYVASLSEAYYKAAVRSAISLKDHYPQAHITLYTHEAFFQECDRKLFDGVVVNIPVHKRAKMWGMARTPYDRTLYVDCDTEIRSDRIKDVFDLLDKDIMFTKIIPHVSNTRQIDDDNELEYHGGIILYNNKPLTVDLIKNWYYTYYEQTNIRDWNKSEYSQYSEKMQPWDQFTIWYLLRQYKYKQIQHGFFPNGGHEYNFIYLLEDDIEINLPYKDLEQIIYHYTIPRGLVDASHIKYKSGIVGDTN